MMGEIDVLFLVCTLGVVATVPVHFLSVEHLKLEAKYGRQKGRRIGEICGLISGWGFFLFWIGLWISPQPRFAIPIFQNLFFVVPVADFQIWLVHMVLFIPFFFAGAWLGIKSLRETSLRVAETHRTERIVTSGAYSSVRHPQYLAGLLAHMGISILLSAWFSLLSTPLVALLVYLVARKEEEELIREYGKEYEDYREKVPMFLPRSRN